MFRTLEKVKCNSCSFVQVTLSEGPHHTAYFKGNSHEYDLTQETDVSDVIQALARNHCLLVV